jgi:hypothetical protein
MMLDGREYTKLVTEDGLNAVLVDPDTDDPVARRRSTKQRGTELLLELEAKRRPLPFRDAADTGSADTGLEVVDSDPHEAAGAGGKLAIEPIESSLTTGQPHQRDRPRAGVSAS